MKPGELKSLNSPVSHISAATDARRGIVWLKGKNLIKNKVKLAQTPFSCDKELL